VRISEVLHLHKAPTKRNRARPQVDWHSARSSNDLTKLTRELTKDGVIKHSRNLNWPRAFLSKTRYMCGRQCSKKLWQTVYDPEPAEEPLPGTVKGIGIEVGVRARLLWPGGVLVDTKYNDYAEAIERTKALIADPTVPAIFEAALAHHGVLIRIDALERLRDGCWRLNEVKSNEPRKDANFTRSTMPSSGRFQSNSRKNLWFAYAVTRGVTQ
jgi:hypothetical protein